jgi:hypothetical protein
MNMPLAFAGFLSILLGVVHSLGGEIEVLPKIEGMRDSRGQPSVSGWSRQVLRGTWHTLSFFGFGLGLVLFVMAFPGLGQQLTVTKAIAISTFAVGAYWAIITRLWHPAWVVFMLVGLLCWLA